MKFNLKIDSITPSLLSKFFLYFLTKLLIFDWNIIENYLSILLNFAFKAKL